MAVSYKVPHDFLSLVDGDSEAQTVSIGDYCRVDADDFAVHVEQRAAGVAGVDCRVGLEEVVKVHVLSTYAPVLGRNHSRSYGLFKAVGVADCDNVFADFNSV